ncbi:hypothetical protein A6R68_06350 [Neotoma lepida]|uniref:Uncharacterized protein n=1 Tax=Neotoma lepida TaxID=56216 RepID=A0A1A6GH76_NEOLE|nr:hypothetical protein A6R68_06350 [Neotoma lepida]
MPITSETQKPPLHCYSIRGPEDRLWHSSVPDEQEPSPIPAGPPPLSSWGGLEKSDFATADLVTVSYFTRISKERVSKKMEKESHGDLRIPGSISHLKRKKVIIASEV